MAHLNPQQLAAVQYLKGPLLVLAGAGSGKTSVIAHKIAWLIREHGLTPNTIAAVTFTNKAAREMKTRLAGMLGAETTRALTISTFHSLGLKILREHATALGRRAGFTLYDTDDAQALVAKLMRGQKKDLAPEAVQAVISRWKNALHTPAASDNPIEAAALRVYSSYEDHLRACNAFDLDDLIVKVVELFRHDATLHAWRERLRYLLVDEYQDTNGSQYELVKDLSAGRGALTVVGDDDQSIYAWRGARAENLRTLTEDYPGLHVIKLEQNYRSCRRILTVANQLIAHNPHLFEKKLWSQRETGAAIRVLTARNEEHEAERVVGEIMAHRFKHGTGYRDYAILYRENHQSRVLERLLRERRIPYFLSGGTSFFDKTEIRDVFAYLKLVSNPDDDGAFLRIVNTPRREIGTATLETLAQHAGRTHASLFRAAFDPDLGTQLNARQLASLKQFVHWIDVYVEQAAAETPGKLVRALLAELHYDEWLKETCRDKKTAERRLENIHELVAWIERLARDPEEETRLPEIVTRLMLFNMLEKGEDSDSADQVALMTLHAAKGLEFPHVFIVGVEEGVLPHHQSQDPAGIEEERRLAYVGITRAKQSLTLLHAAQRRRGGEMVTTEPSRFLAELPKEDLDWEKAGGASSPQESQARADAHLQNLRSLLRQAPAE